MPAADLAPLLDADLADVAGVTIGSYAFVAYPGAYASQVPGRMLNSILTDAGAAAAPVMADLCLLGQNLQQPLIARPLVGGYLRSDPASTPPWSRFLSELGLWPRGPCAVQVLSPVRRTGASPTPLCLTSSPSSRRRCRVPHRHRPADAPDRYA